MKLCVLFFVQPSEELGAWEAYNKDDKANGKASHIRTACRVVCFFLCQDYFSRLFRLVVVSYKIDHTLDNYKDGSSKEAFLCGFQDSFYNFQRTGCKLLCMLDCTTLE